MSVLAHLMLPPLSLLYSAAIHTRMAAYRRGVLPVIKLDAPVISVGNITTGGTGKTPLVEFLSRILAREGRKVCILTRGYGRTSPRKRVLVSDGINVLSNPSDGGDEPFLLAQNLKGIVAVISDPDRVAAGQWAMRELGSDVFVLDDGYQYLRLSRDLNILTIDATNPWGGGSLLPYGRMREPKSGIARADCVVITRSDQGENAVESEVREFLGTKPILMSQMKTKGLKELTSTSREVGAEAVAAFCAVGNPKSFFEHLRGEGYNVVLTKVFADHHNYNQSDIDRLIEDAKRHGAKHLITTSKDAVKLQSLSFHVPCHTLEIEISIKDAVKILELLHKFVPILHPERNDAMSTSNLRPATN